MLARNVNMAKNVHAQNIVRLASTHAKKLFPLAKNI
jgi:hypothetical protein